MQNLEHQTAEAFMHWWAISCRHFSVDEILLHAIPNGGHRHSRVAAQMKAEGVRAGVSDYFLAVPRGGKHGLYLELKRGGVGVKKGYATKEQLNFGSLVQIQGYEFVVAHGLDEAINAVEKYLGAKGLQ